MFAPFYRLHLLPSFLVKYKEWEKAQDLHSLCILMHSSNSAGSEFLLELALLPLLEELICQALSRCLHNFQALQTRKKFLKKIMKTFALLLQRVVQ